MITGEALKIQSAGNGGYIISEDDWENPNIYLKGIEVVRFVEWFFQWLI